MTLPKSQLRCERAVPDWPKACRCAHKLTHLSHGLDVLLGWLHICSGALGLPSSLCVVDSFGAGQCCSCASPSQTNPFWEKCQLYPYHCEPLRLKKHQLAVCLACCLQLCLVRAAAAADLWKDWCIDWLPLLDNSNARLLGLL